MTYSNIIRASEFKDLLMLFAGDVAAKIYNKMPYDKWKGFLKLLDNKNYPYVHFLFETNKESVEVAFLDFDRKSNLTTFGKNDKSFGAFLFREYAHLLENNTMTTSTNTSADATTYNNWNDYSNSVTGSISYSYDGTSAINDTYVMESDWHNHPSHSITVDKDGNLMYNSKRIVCADDNNEKESNKMKNFNFDFGPCNPDTIRMSMYGLAIKNASGAWVSYNPATKQIIDVDVLNFDGAKYMYKMPVGLKEVKVGDIVIHNRKPMFVVGTAKDQSNALMVVDIYAGEEKTIVPAISPFGFNFVTKVVSLFGNMMTTSQANVENPFGNAFMMYALMSDENTDNMLPLMLMAQNGNINNINPFMMMMLCDDNAGSNKNLMAMMAMSGMFGNTVSQGASN